MDVQASLAVGQDGILSRPALARPDGTRYHLVPQRNLHTHLKTAVDVAVVTIWVQSQKAMLDFLNCAVRAVQVFAVFERGGECAAEWS